MRGAHRLPIGEDGEEGDQRKTDGFPLDSFPLMTGAVSRRGRDSAEALYEDRRLSDFSGAHCFARAQTGGAFDRHLRPYRPQAGASDFCRLPSANMRFLWCIPTVSFVFARIAIQAFRLICKALRAFSRLSG